MGNCVVTNNLPHCKHELLNELDYQYFDGVQEQARNYGHRSEEQNRKNRAAPWNGAERRDKTGQMALEQGKACPLSEPQLIDAFTLSVSSNSGSRSPLSCSSSPAHMAVLQAGDDASGLPLAESPWKPSLTSTGLTFQSRLVSNGSPFPNSFPDYRDYAATEGGCQVKRKGRALRLRLAKYRFLQLQATRESNLMSPDPRSIPLWNDGLPPPLTDNEWDTDFQTNGMVRLPINRENEPLTALGMSRTAGSLLRKGGCRDVKDVPMDAAALHCETQPPCNVIAVAYSQSNRKSKENPSYVAFAADNGALTIMTVKERKTVLQMEFAKPLRAIAFSRCSTFLALGGDEKVLYVLALPSRSIVFTTIFISIITAVAFSRHDERLAVGTRDGLLTLLCPYAGWEPVGELHYDSKSPFLEQGWCFETLAASRRDGSVAVVQADECDEPS